MMAARASAAHRTMDPDRAAARLQAMRRGQLERREVSEKNVDPAAPVQATPKPPAFASPDRFAGTYRLQGSYSIGRVCPSFLTWHVSSLGLDKCGCGRQTACFTQLVCGLPCCCTYMCEVDDGIYGSPSTCTCLPCLMVYQEDSVGVCFVPFLVHEGTRGPNLAPGSARIKRS